MAKLRASVKNLARSPRVSPWKPLKAVYLNHNGKSKKPRKDLWVSAKAMIKHECRAWPWHKGRCSRSGATDAILSMDAIRTHLCEVVSTMLLGQKGSQVGFLHLCAFEDAWDMTDLLISAGASVDLVPSNGETPLHWAASTDAAKTAQLLLDFGVDMERRDSSGSTAILRAVVAGCPRVLAVLLSRGGKVEAVDNDGRSCIDLAESALEREDMTIGDGTVAAVVLKRHFADGVTVGLTPQCKFLSRSAS